MKCALQACGSVLVKCVLCCQNQTSGSDIGNASDMFEILAYRFIKYAYIRNIR